MTAKKVVRRRPVKPQSDPPIQVEKEGERTHDAQVVREKNRNQSAGEDTSPKIHAKVVNLHVSIGTSDRARIIEDFIEEIKARLEAVPYGEDGIHASVMSSHYILDGKVCLSQDYDSDKGTFKKGATPPQWAGGPEPAKVKSSTNGSTSSFDRPRSGRLIKPKTRAEILAERESDTKKNAPADDIDFEWDASQVEDEKAHAKVAAKSKKAAVKKLRINKKKG